MSEKHKLDKDGILKDGVSHYPADTHDMQTYEDARQALSRFQAPVLLHSGNPHERLYLAAFDGTGNDADKDPEHATNVDWIRDQVEALDAADLKVGYVPGPGTQDSPIARAWDGARGHTYDERLEKMYELFINQAWEWRREDPNAEIRIANLGFSRGAEQAAGFARLVHERGIQDPTGAVYTRDRQGQITGVTYTKPPLALPGQTAQAVGLFDPVGTGEPVEEKDRRLPPSVISGFQIISEDERRSLFKSSHIIDPGLSPDGRFLGVIVAGAHSDIGGSYHRDGLGIRSGNLMAAYLNSFSDRAFIDMRPEPNDLRLNVVHRSEESMLIYRVTDKVDRLKPEGYTERLVPQERSGRVADPYNAEPRDEALNRQFERQPVRIGPTSATPAREHSESAPTAPAVEPATQASSRKSPQSHVDDLLNRLAAAATSKDDAGMKAVTHDYLRSPQGQAWTQEVRDQGQQLKAQEQQAALEMQQQRLAQQQAQEALVHKSPVMHH